MVGGNWVVPVVVLGREKEGWMNNAEMLADSRRRLWEDDQCTVRPEHPAMGSKGTI
jgi:hypothetical protein